MKRNLLILTTLGISLSLGSMVYAHCGKCGVGDDNHAEKKMDKMDKMSDGLNLTPEQTAQIDAIKKEKHEKIDALHEETKAKIKALLNDEQKAKFDAMHQPGDEHGMKCGPECKDGCTKECKMKKKKMKKEKADK